MNHEKIMQLDPIIHAPTRLAILSILLRWSAQILPF